MKKPLSPAAQNVWSAFNDVYERTGTFEDFGDALAAAFRAAEDQVEWKFLLSTEYTHWDSGYNAALTNVCEQLSKIANELES